MMVTSYFFCVHFGPCLIDAIIIYSFNEDVDRPGDGEGINKVVGELKVSSNDVGESAVECQGMH